MKGGALTVGDVGAVLGFKVPGLLQQFTCHGIFLRNYVVGGGLCAALTY